MNLFMKLPYELIEYIYTFYNPHKDNYTKFVKDFNFTFMDHRYMNLEIMYLKKMIYEYELKISAFGFNIMGTDILKCIFFKRKQIGKISNKDLKKYWIYLLYCDLYEEEIYNNKHMPCFSVLDIKIDLTCPWLNRLEFGDEYDILFS